MAECELLGTCDFFNLHLDEMPSTAESLKNRYCKSGDGGCARYQVWRKLGKERIPQDLLPGDVEEAKEILFFR